KPISIEELIVAVTKAQQQSAKHDMFDRNKIIVENFRETKPEKQAVILPPIGGLEVAKMEEIIRLRGSGNFTDLSSSAGRKERARRLLKHFAEILPLPFLRGHKSHIVNLNFVRSYNKGGYLTLLDDDAIEVSSTYKEEFLRNF